MSGGHFDYQQHAIKEMANSIAVEIARALQPKPPMIHEDYWVIFEHNNLCSFHHFRQYLEFETYEEAESFLFADKSVVVAEHSYGIHLMDDNDKIFCSTRLFMKDTKDSEPIPWLYIIHHCVYDHYPFDAGVLELSAETIETMKEAYLQIRKAYVYAQRVDWMLSCDDGEDCMQSRLKTDMEEVQDEYDNKDWTCPYEGWNEND